MKIALVSDTHQEFWEKHEMGTRLTSSKTWYEALHDIDYDVLVLAGDIDSSPTGLYRLFLEFPKKVTLFVDGNHEYYGQNINTYHDRLKKVCEDTGVRYLNNSSTDVEGYKFYGGCMWTDFDKSVHNEAVTLNGVNCYRRIKNLTIDKTKEMFYDFMDGLIEADPDVVISHFAPHRNSIVPKYQGNALNAYFVANLDEKFFTPKLWMHGHTHSPVDYVVGNTRVVANQRGYPNENYEYRDPYRYRPKIIEI